MSRQLPLSLALPLTAGDRLVDGFNWYCTFNRLENLSCLNGGRNQGEFSQLHRLVWAKVGRTTCNLSISALTEKYWLRNFLIASSLNGRGTAKPKKHKLD